MVGATTVTMGLITLPTMLRYGYDKRLAAGTVAATSTLAQIFPPATVLVLLGDQLNNSYQAAQLAKGNFAPDSVSVGDLFAGALVPAFALVGLYILYLIGMAVFRPKTSPSIPPNPDAPRGLTLARQLAEVLVAPIVLIVVVLGSILGGLASPTEAAAVGAFGAILLTARKIDPGHAWAATLAVGAIVAALVLRASPARLGGSSVLILVALVLFSRDGGRDGRLLARRASARRRAAQALDSTAQIAAMIFAILIGATFFSLVFRGLGGDDLVHRALEQPAGRRRAPSSP